jgi:hypothetical protein
LRLGNADEGDTQGPGHTACLAPTLARGVGLVSMFLWQLPGLQLLSEASPTITSCLLCSGSCALWQLLQASLLVGIVGGR